MSSYNVPTWFCSVNKSSVSQHQTDGTVNINRCITDTIIAVPHVAFVVVTLLQLTILKYWRHLRQLDSSSFHLRYPGHTLRWILAFFVFLLGAASFAEGLVTDGIYRKNDFPTQPHFYLPGIFTMAGIVTAMTTLNFAEVWRFKHMLWTLLCYWALSLVTTVIGLHFNIKVHQSVEDTTTISMNSLLLLLLTVCYAVLVLGETISLYKIVFCRCLEQKKDDNCTKFLPEKPWAEERMFYQENFSNFPSQLTFWWLNFLFATGFKRPIIYEKLGTIPENHTVNHIYARFKMIYEDEKAECIWAEPQHHEHNSRVFSNGFILVAFSINSGTPIIVTLIAFAVYTPLNDTPLTPDTAFSSLALFNLISVPLILLPHVLNLSVTLKVSVKRLVEFLGSPEVKPLDDNMKVRGPGPPPGRRCDGDMNGGSRSERVVKTTPLSSVLETDEEDLQTEDDVFLSVEEMNQRNVGRNGVAGPIPNGTKLQSDQDCTDGLRRDALQRDLPDDIAIRIRNGNFVWDATSSSPDVSNVDITIPAGKLTIIVGAVGSGKSSLLGAMMGEMTARSGIVQIHK
eukprot:XP_011679317.1 PREDICTED: ATP-binding cassette sub-family C member 9-like [Strongylocentrotus purpuratus]